MENTIVLHGHYRHYKTQMIYEVMGFALHSETREEMVIYKALYNCEEFGNNRVWVRPKNMFLEKVNYQGHILPRFELISKFDFDIINPEN